MDFRSEVYWVVRSIPKGKVTTYGEIAKLLGKPSWSRRVGWALHQNRDSKTPCHRVVDRNGRLAPNFGGPSLESFGRLAPSKFQRSGAFDGAEEQRRRLTLESVDFEDEMHVDLSSCLWQEKS